LTTTSSPFEASTVDPLLANVSVTFLTTGGVDVDAPAINVPVDTRARAHRFDGVPWASSSRGNLALRRSQASPCLVPTRLKARRGAPQRFPERVPVCRLARISPPPRKKPRSRAIALSCLNNVATTLPILSVPRSGLPTKPASPGEGHTLRESFPTLLVRISHSVASAMKSGIGSSERWMRFSAPTGPVRAWVSRPGDALGGERVPGAPFPQPPVRRQTAGELVPLPMGA
jgi:hypothetical protein